jgi:Xaa-Pro dipeptidase
MGYRIVAMTTDIHAQRLTALQALLAERGIDLAVLQFATDLYYYTGSTQPLYLLVPRTGEACVLARKALARIEEEAPGYPLYPFAGSKDLAAVFGKYPAVRVGFTLDTLSAASFQRLLPFFPGAEVVDLAADIRALRMVKDEAEIAILTRAGHIMAMVPELVRTHLRPGVTELALSAALEYAFRLAGHDLLIRSRREGVEMSACGICVAGARTLAGSKFEGIAGGVGLSPAVPYGATRTVIAPGEPILIDIAFVLEGYHLDQTRMACLGAPAAEVTRAYDAMLDVQAAVFAALRPGTPWEEVYTLAANRAAALGYADTFMGRGREQVKFVGHGVGLELDEPPVLAPKLRATLAANMTLAIEPKVALPNLGVIGIEDTVVIREGGIERLTVCPPEMIIIE